MRKQFDLKYYKKHPDTKVVTRLGHKVRIVCTDIKGAIKPVISAITITKNHEDSCMHYVNGRVFSDKEQPLDLFFDLPDPVKKKVPLTYEDMLQRVKDGKTMWTINDRDTVFNIVDFDFEFVYVINGDTREVVPYSYEELMNGISFADGTPCWKEVEE